MSAKQCMVWVTICCCACIVQAWRRGVAQRHVKSTQKYSNFILLLFFRIFLLRCRHLTVLYSLLSYFYPSRNFFFSSLFLFFLFASIIFHISQRWKQVWINCSAVSKLRQNNLMKHSHSRIVRRFHWRRKIFHVACSLCCFGFDVTPTLGQPFQLLPRIKWTKNPAWRFVCVRAPARSYLIHKYGEYQRMEQ